MNKKLLAFIVIIATFFTFITACKPEDKSSTDAQISLIAENAEVWNYDYYSYIKSFHYCVTDLDQNGRLEIISSVNMGTGLYTDSYYFEVDETYTMLVPWEHITGNYTRAAQADIIVDDTDCFVNPETQATFYIFNDTLRATAANNCTYKLSPTFKNSTVTEELLAYYAHSAATTDEAGNYEVTTNIQTADGSPLTDDEFFAYPETYFKGYEKHTVTFGWQRYTTENDSPITNLTHEELVNLLSESYENFSVT